MEIYLTVDGQLKLSPIFPVIEIRINTKVIIKVIETWNIEFTTHAKKKQFRQVLKLVLLVTKYITGIAVSVAKKQININLYTNISTPENKTEHQYTQVGNSKILFVIVFEPIEKIQ